MDLQLLRDDFGRAAGEMEAGCPETVPVDRPGIDAAATALRGEGVVQETLRAAGWRPGRRIPID
ncbi:hypothetical protein [Streptomyces sp. NPDC001851]|uniref:hypothetical protein n=1 Tax=Streptomyces sp. NPDC001851 TaxID=3154529 RepID=UPI00331FAF4A